MALAARPKTGGIAASVAPAEPGKAPIGTALLQSIEELALHWHARSWRGTASIPVAGTMTPEELSLTAREQGLEVRFEERSLASLQPADFPCVALARDGGGIVLARRESTQFYLRASGQTQSLSLADLEALTAGVVFFVRPEGQPDDGTAPGEADPRDERGLFGTVLVELFAHHRGVLGQLVLAAILSNLFLIALPIFSMAVYDRVVPHLAYETLWALSIGVAAVLVADMVIRVIRLKLADAASLTIAISLQSKLYGRILHARFGRAPVPAGLLANGMRDIEGLCQCIPALVVSLCVDLPWFLGVCALLYAVAGAVAWTPVIGVALLVLVHAFGHFARRRSQVAARLAARQSDVAAEMLGSLEAVKVATAERMLLRRWEVLSDESAFATHRSRLSSGTAVQASVVIGQAMIVVALVIGVYEMGNHAITIGGLSAATLLVGRMMGPASQMMGLLHRASELRRATRAVEAMLAAPQETAGDPTRRSDRPIAGLIEFRDVALVYPGETAPALSGITLRIEPGERVGIIGRIGSGKSTLIRMMLRLYEPSDGSVSLDGHDIRQISPRDIRRAFGFMRQDSVLFDDTLRANLCYGLDAVPVAAFERAAALSGVADFAARHAQGYGLRVGPRGERLSGGERQSVALARTLAGDPRVLLLDEPTASMDNMLEARIVRDLAGWTGDRTLIVATHRAPLLALVDRLLWIENGRLMADGPKAEVMARIQSGSVAT